MKIKKRFALITLLLLALVGVVSASYWIYSNITEDTLNYEVSLSTERKYSKYTLTATLTDNGTPIKSEAVVFEVSTDGVHWETVGTEITDTYGVAIIEYEATSNGDYKFRASYFVA